MRTLGRSCPCCLQVFDVTEQRDKEARFRLTKTKKGLNLQSRHADHYERLPEGVYKG